MKHALTAVTATLLAVGSVAAFAQTPGGSETQPGGAQGAPQGAPPQGAQGGGAPQGQREAPKFSDLDQNNDGAISKNEAQAVGLDGAVFDSLDENDDGRLSEPEFAKATGG